jgi:hypothetical protein
VYELQAVKEVESRQGLIYTVHRAKVIHKYKFLDRTNSIWNNSFCTRVVKSRFIVTAVISNENYCVRNFLKVEDV